MFYNLFFIFLFFFENFTHCQEIQCISIAKCGTHLLTRCVELLTDKKTVYIKALQARKIPVLAPNEFLHRHAPYSIEREKAIANCKNFFIYRDPRDQIVSQAFWIMKRSEKHPWCNYQKVCPLTLNQIINKLIQRVDTLYRKFLPWFKVKSVCPIRFEDLIGPNGKGSQERQLYEITKIASHLNIKSPELIAKCMKNIFGNTGTFRKGEIGDWKNHFTKRHIRRFKKAAGKLLIELGYEKDLNW